MEDETMRQWEKQRFIFFEEYLWDKDLKDREEQIYGNEKNV